MFVKKTVGTVSTLAHEAVGTAFSVARHPIGSTALAAGLVKGVAGAGLNFVRTTVTGSSPMTSSSTSTTSRAADDSDDADTSDTDTSDTDTSDTDTSDTSDTDTSETSDTAASTLSQVQVTEQKEDDDPRASLPGPDLAAFEPPRPEDLPEPIVIEADDDGPGESFHTEPKAANRDSARGGTPGDHEEIEGYVEEIPTDDIDIVTPVGTTGADVGFNPDTAEADLQQPQTPELLEPSVVHAIESESEMLRRAADPNPE